MKTLLYNPIFINPQAYYVFPRLTRYLQPDNESTAEPANYIGTIEVKVIAYGDTTLKRTYTNTDSIDLSEFKNTWIHISLFTKVGSCVLGEWKIGNMESDLPYIDPEVLASLKAVVIVGNKTNNDSDRAIVKNLVDASNPFVISNAAFKLNSGFGKYETELSNTRIWTQSKETTSSPFSSNYNGLSGWIVFANTELTNSADMPSFKIQVKGLLEGQELIYRYYDSTGQTNVYSMTKDGKYTLPADVRTAKPLTSNTSGFQIVKNETNTITITQIPSFVGAFVTDGINDIITSTKTVQEMLGGSNEFTVVSMMANLDSVQMMCNSNYNNTNGYNPRNTLEPNGVISMLGYTDKNGTTNNLNLIMGDKDSIKLVDKVNFNSDYVFYPAQYYGAYYKAAWYWTVIANKVLTTDQINQVIAYFNLDRTLKPDILCDVKKQGITNENHAEFGDKLIDYSGNGRDIQLNNIAWKGDSGIGKYETDFLDSSIWKYKTNSSVTSDKIVCNKAATHIMLLYYNITDGNKYDVPSFNVLKQGDASEYYYIDEQGTRRTFKLLDGINTLPASHGTLFTGTEATCGFGNPGIGNSVTITQIPSHAGGLCLDGVNDFGKVTGMPIYKDYTVVADRELFNAIGCVLSNDNPGAFIFETSSASVYSFGEATTSLTIPTDKQIRYQTKYSYNGQNISIGAVKEGTSNMWLGTIRDNDARFRSAAIYSLMSFPYSMSEFLIERQLKKHKLGTLYPNMVEFRPVIKSNTSYDNIVFYYKNEKVENGTYLTVGSSIGMHIRLSSSPVNEIKSITVNGIPATFKFHDANNNIYQYDFNLTSKSPQKIDITIDEYIRYEDIVQPYPLLFEFTDENGNLISWGGKAKVGNTITRTKSVSNANILAGLYNTSNYKLNGKPLEGNSYVVEKSMIFTCTATYLLDNNEPKCILSPRRLRMPNSSYKILGYIPDISGHGNHGKINNSAYAEGSGVNEDGSYQLDGVDDHITIPTLSSGGKQVLMKVNWNTINSIIYDQKGSGGFAIYCSDYNNPSDSITVPAYKGRNAAGTTYIDGIRNEYIIASQLRNVTHNIVEILDTSYAAGNINPIIGKSYMNSNYGSLALYDFMLFDNISTDDKIKQLNEYVGIEAKVELPPYYWDAYGKTNLDADKATIQQRGTAVGDYDLTNHNHAYEGMSGYNGYPVVFGANKTWEVLSSVYSYTSDVTSTTIHVTMVKNAGTGLLFSYVKKDGALTNIKEIPAFRVTIKGLEGNSKFGYRYLATEDATGETLVYLGNGTHELAKSFAPTEALLDLTRNAWVGIFITPMVEGEVVFDCDITIEVLPEYENGLAYDGVSDFSDNKNIPIFTDFTAIIKRIDLDAKNNNSAVMFKGNKIYESSIGNGFILDYHYNSKNYVYSYSKINQIERDDSKIIYLTPESYNGNPIIKGENGDNLGLVLGKYWKGIIYKTILYSKTISLLEINFLKNLMEKDEIIDLNNKIFIQE